MAKTYSVGLLSAFLSLSNAQAIQLNVEGEAVVNNGSGFKPVPAMSEVNPGDRVRVLTGCATIAYDNGSSTKVCANDTALVLSNPPPLVASSSISESSFHVGATEILLGGAAIAGGYGLYVATKPASP